VIALLDYGAGNLTSVRKALSALGTSTWTPESPSELVRATGIIVPGVGHFESTAAIGQDWRAAIVEATRINVPLLGICVGLQWLFEGSQESLTVPGLSLFKGTCFNFTEHVSGRLKVPHVGWNSLTLPRPTRLMQGVKSGDQVYFTHSFAAPVINDTAAICEYGVPFSAAVERGHVSAVQFHPEKSGDVGLRILQNWIAQVPVHAL
jgi:glutamine amidotransferase